MRNAKFWCNATVPPIWHLFLFGEALSPLNYQRKQLQSAKKCWLWNVATATSSLMVSLANISHLSAK